MSRSKVIGFFTAWGNQEWALPALKNHLQICSQVIVSVEPHCKEMMPFRDNTEARLRQYANEATDKNIMFIPYLGVMERTDNPDVGKCMIYNYMLKWIEKEDTIMLCDSDEFYGEKTVSMLKAYLRGAYDWDMLRIYDRMFCVNLKWYVLASHGRFIRHHKGDKSEFYPTQNIQPAPKLVRTVCQNEPMFHYSMLQNIQARRIFWTREGHSYRMQWLKHIYSKWEPNNPQLCESLAEKNRGITGHYGFWFSDGVEEEDGPPFLFKYEDDHPNEIMESSIMDKEIFVEWQV